MSAVLIAESISPSVPNDEPAGVPYHTWRSYDVKVKTEERLAVLWGEQDLLGLVALAFSENAVADVATLREQGLLGGGLSQLNVRLVPHGWRLDLVRDQGWVVGVVRRRISPGRSRRHDQEAAPGE